MLKRPKREQTTHISIGLKSEILKANSNIRKGGFHYRQEEWNEITQ